MKTLLQMVESAPVQGIIEFKDRAGNWHDFTVITLPDRLLFGGTCNVGFLESGYMLRDDAESLDESLAELLAELETYYNDGARYAPRLVCNRRM
jgi:hypothetical protein